MASDSALRRRLDAALVGGVCAGIADYLGVRLVVARAATVASIALSGIGFVLYAIAWALIPGAGRRPAAWSERLLRAREAIAVAFLTGVAILALRRLGLWLGNEVVFPLLLASSGLALVLRQALAPEDLAPAPSRRLAVPPWRRWPAGVLGVLLVAGGAILFLHDAGVGADHGRTLIETAVALLAVSLLVVPYLFGLARRLTVERAQRIRSEERAEMAAHLHDSVLQTLALIQRQAGDPARVQTLARAQERDLRDWLLAQDMRAAPATLRAALEATAREVEARHAVRVETVIVGDCPLDERLRALVAAAREALVNAAKFAGVERIDLYAEAAEDRTELFVRDRGVGFDPEGVPPDRQGIRRSIRERMDRHGGTALLHSAVGDGTEVALTMERARA